MNPLAPGESIAGQRYVSDVLEGLLDASETRAAMRAHCIGLLRELPPKMRLELEPVAAYVGGKCMGYPAIWFLELLLRDRGIARNEIVRRAGTTFALSLSTSIVDDLADDDETLGSEYLAFLYVLLGQRLFAERHADTDSLHALYHALDVCLNPTAERGAYSEARRGDRIGAFYGLIAARVLDGVFSPEQASAAVEAITQFGEACAHIDDWMDLERDFTHDVRENVLLVMLRDRLAPKQLVAADILRHRAWLRNEIGVLLTKRMAEIAATLKPLPAEKLGDALGSVVLRLPAALDAIAASPRPLLHSI